MLKIWIGISNMDQTGSVLQTIAFNKGFKNKIYKPLNLKQTSNMRFIDWKRGANGNPYTFTIEDYELLKQSDALFARKVSQTIDKEVIERISLELMDC